MSLSLISTITWGHCVHAGGILILFWLFGSIVHHYFPYLHPSTSLVILLSGYTSSVRFCKSKC
ncbi:hypothetical protein ASPFODRAFT_39189 [Aspergillus luchuensis CBS 106.47]|uniref:Uncharacterized protein n=1 Tax=Aspergillus luchuensis (strain CBS 106.47) TaxID=1137211 RepID=A0A1M3TZ02_ASPLC|nr:hypothetical protein ASPFODRAFT_39189 [Aspergillus luchuensis CBS 106.47]